MNQRESKSHQKDKVYKIRAEFNNDTFTVSIEDDATIPNKFEQQFTQNHFPNIKLFDVAKTVVDAINNTIQDKPNAPKVTCKEWNGMAFVSIMGSNIPTLALIPKTTNANQLTAFKQNPVEQYVPTYVVFQRIDRNMVCPQLVGMWCYVGVSSVPGAK
eukprot:265588_1